MLEERERAVLLILSIELKLQLLETMGAKLVEKFNKERNSESLHEFIYLDFIELAKITRTGNNEDLGN